MDKDFGICGRENEMKAIYNFVINRVESNLPGILYLTGPPGTGKTMSIDLILEKVKNVPKMKLNCFKAQTAKIVLSRICEALDLKIPSKACESALIGIVAKKLTGRTCKPFIMVLDEMDQLPKSSNPSFFHNIFSWTKQSFSKLIIIGIANTVNLTARCQTFPSFTGTCDRSVDKIIFKPYNSKDLFSILNWYLENDENFEEANVEPKVLEYVSKKVAKEKGDVRRAIDMLRDMVYDSKIDQTKESTFAQKSSTYPTPPSTPPPPLTPRKQKTNLTVAVTSTRKRQRESHYRDDKMVPVPEIVLICLHKLCSSNKDCSIDSKTFYGKVSDVMLKYGLTPNHLDIKSALEQLELQGTITFKRRPRMLSDKILLKASENEISRLSEHRQSIQEFVSRFI